MRIELKPGVEIEPLVPAGARILDALKNLPLPFACVITSGRDGVHSGPQDPHKLGEAYDLRTHGLTEDQKQTWLKMLQSDLGSRFYAFLEAPGAPEEHIHCQRAKGTVYTLDDYLNNR